MSFVSFGLSADIVRAITVKGYTVATPIQQQAIPAVLAGRDLMAAAQTGTGKTAAFTLPLLERLIQLPSPASATKVRALVLTPTRELAGQVSESVRDYGKFLSLRSGVVFGGVNINPQMKTLRRGVDILVATPGRLIDHMTRRTVDLSQVSILVLDEADRMLDMGFLPAIERIVSALPSQRQTLLFSATFSPTIKKLAARFLKSPQMIEVSQPNTAASTVTQLVYKVDHERKRELLSHMIGQQNLQQVLIFTRTKRGADRLAKQLVQDGIQADAIHGDKSQGARTRALADFKRNRIRALVATDVAARGIDIDQLSHVVNYELPDDIENYVHRIGRTGRAGKSGTAISLIGAHEQGQLRDIEKLLNTRLSLQVIEGYEPTNKPGANNDAPRRAANKPRRAAPAREFHHRGAKRSSPGHGKPRHGGAARTA
ncbi:MAG: DEAD/DEAH box helicase [Gammaproteobacteria bacterium]|nr:DEAD/DEAH box helicase [Gammaproteobacteria bacterium]